MDKNRVLLLVIECLKARLQTVVQSALDAREAATHEESKSENEYDTRGLEASYLAGAQAKRADEIKIQVAQLESMAKKGLPSCEKVQSGALVRVDVNGERQQWFFVLPVAGGEKIQVKSEEIQIVTPSAPLGQRLMDQSEGDSFEMQIGDSVGDYEILQVL